MKNQIAQAGLLTYLRATPGPEVLNSQPRKEIGVQHISCWVIYTAYQETQTELRMGKGDELSTRCNLKEKERKKK